MIEEYSFTHSLYILFLARAAYGAIDIAMEDSGMTAGWRTSPEIQKMVNCSTKDNRITGDDLWVST